MSDFQCGIQTLKYGGGDLVSKKKFFGPRFGLKIRDGGQAPQRPSPGSATDLFALSFFYQIIE